MAGEWAAGGESGHREAWAVVRASGIGGMDKVAAGRMETGAVWTQNSCQFLMGRMSRVGKREESRATPRFPGNWVD